MNRATFLRHSGALVALGVFGRALPARAALVDPGPGLEHPEPRPGITGERVLTPEALGSPREKDVLPAYEYARTYPGVFDGLACACGCTEHGPAHRSLLVCYETKQPTGCWGCRSEAKFVAEMAKEQKSLAEIRAAVDKKFG